MLPLQAANHLRRCCLDIERVPKPDGVPLDRWLQTFPSYGYLLAAPLANLPALLARFGERGIAAAEIGTITADRRMLIRDGAAAETIWDFAREPLIGCAPTQVLA